MDQLDEYEQDENVRKWLRHNGGSLITGISLGLACVFAWQWWQGHQQRHREEAAAQFTAFADALTAKDATKANTFAALLADKYANTPYAELASMRHAAFLQDQGKPDQALKLLESAAQKTTDDPLFAELIDLRLARLLLIDGKTEQARQRIEAIKEPLLPEIAYELRGDIEAARGQRELARKNYEQALTALDQAAPTRRLLELKLIDVGGRPSAQPEA